MVPCAAPDGRREITPPFAAIRPLVGLGTVAAVVLLLQEYVLPDSSQDAFAKRTNVPRRHLESRSAWTRRTVEAYRKRSAAYEQFLQAAKERGQYHEYASGRGYSYTLPIRDPAAVALLHARYPDGPSLDQLRALAGLEEP